VTVSGPVLLVLLLALMRRVVVVGHRRTCASWRISPRVTTTAM
jgi:hypothetical protein